MIDETNTELQQKLAALEKANSELNQFAYVVSHDLRAPLRAIGNLSLWIEEEIGDEITEDAKKYMTLLRNRVKRMEDMISGILEYSRIGRVNVALENVNVADLIAETVDSLGVPKEFLIKIDDNLPILRTPRLRLSQVFQNLIGNAVKHHHRKDGNIHIGGCDKGEFYEFAVSDDGPGIAPEYHEKVFVIFQTLQARDNVEGTGIGLTLVKKIIEELGGVIAIDSEVGKGTTFRFTWPKNIDKEQSV